MKVQLKYIRLLRSVTLKTEGKSREKSRIGMLIRWKEMQWLYNECGLQGIFSVSGYTTSFPFATFTHPHSLSSILEPYLHSAWAHSELLTQICPQLGRRKKGLLKDLVQDLQLVRRGAPALDLLVCCRSSSFLGRVVYLERASVPGIRFGAGRRRRRWRRW